jgi:hypothetical protein
MEHLLAMKGIKIISSFDRKGVVYKYAYTVKMLSNDLFIEFYERDYEPGEDEKDDGIVKNETSLNVVTYYKKVAYHFMMLNEIKPQPYTTKQAVPVIQLYAMIITLVDIIERNVPRKLIGLLKQASIDTFTSLEYSSEPEFQKAFHDSVVNKISSIRRIIEQEHPKGN